jgi:inorganic phosphate transporter, PiT family
MAHGLRFRSALVGDALKAEDGNKPDVYGALATLSADIGRQVKECGAIKAVPSSATTNVRTDMYLASDTVRVMGSTPPGFDDADVSKLKSMRSSIAALLRPDGRSKRGAG